MTMIKHEWRQHRVLFWVWTLVILGMNLMIIMMYPQMADQMENVNEMFANMGSFTAAFGMDRLSIGTPLGFYGVEGGSMMGIGGGMLMALLGGIIICKEEANHTAEFLYTLPQKRTTVLLTKFVTVVLLAIVFYLACTATAWIGFLAIGESVDMKWFLLYHLAQFFAGLVIAMICFGISAFLSKTNFGLAIGVALGFYFLQVLANITEKAEWLRFFTPYYFADASKVIGEEKMQWGLILLGIVYGVLIALAGAMYYKKKDLHS